MVQIKSIKKCTYTDAIIIECTDNITHTIPLKSIINGKGVCCTNNNNDNSIYTINIIGF